MSFVIENENKMAFNLYILSLLFIAPFFIKKDVDPSNEKIENTKHPFYVSVLEMEQNPSEKSLEFSYKFFIDDFENTLEKKFKTSLDFTSAKDNASFDKFIPAYINNVFSLVVDGKPVGLKYIGYEIEKESVYCYFEALNISFVKKIDINNGLLYEYYKDQMNIMHININGKRQSVKLAFPGKNASFQF